MLIHDKFAADLDSCIITYEQKALVLSPKEYRLLLLFLKFPYQVLTYDRIREYLHDASKDDFITESTVRTHIKLLRKSLREVSSDDNIIQNVRGLGYRLKLSSDSGKVEKALLTPSISVMRKFIKSQKIEYLVLDKNLTINSVSQEIAIYCDYPDEIKIGNYGGYAFPELIGYQEALEKVIKEEEPFLLLKGIKRINNHNQISYINIYVIAEPDDVIISLDNQQLFVFFENCSNEMLFKQRLVQYANQTALNPSLPQKPIPLN